jgi:outer membrane protein OmpA-like peptidoglycan-associated protein
MLLGLEWHPDIPEPPPPPDRDEDGIPDQFDACPDVPGIKTDDPKTNGCPPPPPNPDRDGDGILNEVDACPDVAGPANEDPKKNGCPLARVENGQIKITEQVKFANASSQILKESDTVLNAVLEILTQHPEIEKLKVQGYTDNKGAAAYNKTLSKQRAGAVKNWLVLHKVDAKRLESDGYGADDPIDDNTTEAGRKNNRRVEFHIGEKAAPGTVPPPPATPAAPKK